MSILPVRKYAALSRSDRKLILAAARALAVSLLGLRIFGFAAVRKFVGSKAGRRKLWAAPPPVEKISWAVQAASAYLPGCTNCLVRALATEYLLDRFGYPAKLRIGVAKDDSGGIAAHAWLESEGRVVIGDFELGRYAPLAANPENTSRSQLRGMV